MTEKPQAYEPPVPFVVERWVDAKGREWQSRLSADRANARIHLSDLLNEYFPNDYVCDLENEQDEGGGGAVYWWGLLAKHPSQAVKFLTAAAPILAYLNRD